MLDKYSKVRLKLGNSVTFGSALFLSCSNNTVKTGISNEKTKVLKSAYNSVNKKYGLANFPIGFANDNKRK